MARSKFERLGDYVGNRRAQEVRRLAKAGDKAALVELQKIDQATTPEALSDRVLTILHAELNRLEKQFALLQEQTFYEAHGPKLDAPELANWASKNEIKFGPDSHRGMLSDSYQLLAQSLIERGGNSFDLGFILGYGLAQRQFVAVREFVDGPAIAREADLADARSRGGTGRAASHSNDARDKGIYADYKTAVRVNPSLLPASWAQNHHKEYDLSPERLRKIVVEQQKKAGQAQST